MRPGLGLAVARRCSLAGGLGIFGVLPVDAHEDRRTDPFIVDDRDTGRQVRQIPDLCIGEIDGAAGRGSVVGGDEAVEDLNVGVLQYIRRKLGRNLVDDDETFTVGTHLGEHIGE
jgi:hypothetical protein